MGKAETRARMPRQSKESRKQTAPKSNHAGGFKDGLARDSTIASKIDWHNFRISDILIKSSFGWHCYEMVTQRRSLPPFPIAREERTGLETHIEQISPFNLRARP